MEKCARAVSTRMARERERPNARPAPSRLDFPVGKMGPSQAQGIYLQVLDSDGNAPAATGKKDCNNELYGQATCGRRVGGTVQCNMRCACHASQARTETTHVSLCTVSGVLITSCRQSYVRQATREKRVRETIQYATCVPCVMLEREGSLRATLALPLLTAQAH